MVKSHHQFTKRDTLMAIRPTIARQTFAGERQQKMRPIKNGTDGQRAGKSRA
jgi:hypothetical protein